MKKYKIAYIPGDGIGRETGPEGVRVLEAAARKFGIEFKFDEFDWSSIDEEDTKEPDYCFFCDCKQDKKDTRLVYLWSIINDNIGRCHAKTLARKVQIYYYPHEGDEK